MSLYINIAYNSPTGEERIIEVSVDETPTYHLTQVNAEELETVHKKGTITLSANAAGFGWMASLITDFLLDDHPDEIVYRLSETIDLANGSPTLRFAFDPEI